MSAPTATATINLARRYRGIKETPHDSNLQQFGAWYGMNGVAWCAIFQSFILYTIGFRFAGADTAKGWSYCPSIFNYFHKRGLTGSSPRVGALVLFWNGARFHHVEMVTKVYANGSFDSIGGNTGAENLSNGGEVLEHNHANTAGTAFCYLPYAAEAVAATPGVKVVHPVPAPKRLVTQWTRTVGLTSPMTSGPDVGRASAALARKGYKCGTPANVFGPQMDKAVRAYQKSVGLVADGVLGPVTAAHLGL